MHLQRGTSLLEFMVVSALSIMLLVGAVGMVQTLLHTAHRQFKFGEQQEQLWLVADFLRQQLSSTQLSYCGAKNMPEPWQVLPSAQQYDAKLSRSGSGQALKDSPLLVLHQRQENCETALPINAGSQGLHYPCEHRLKANEWLLIQDCMHFILVSINRVSRWQGQQWVTLSKPIPDSFQNGALVSAYEEVAFYFGRNPYGDNALYQQMNHGSRQEVATLPGMKWAFKTQGQHLWTQLWVNSQQAMGRIRRLHVWLS